MIQFYGYDNCSTCRNAKKWLEARGIAFESIDITQSPPPRKMLKAIVDSGAYELGQLYNTSGRRYREKNIAEQRKTLSDQQQLDLLAGDGMLIKRPIVTDGRRHTVGFREAVFEEVWGA